MSCFDLPPGLGYDLHIYTLCGVYLWGQATKAASYVRKIWGSWPRRRPLPAICDNLLSSIERSIYTYTLNLHTGTRYTGKLLLWTGFCNNRGRVLLVIPNPELSRTEPWDFCCSVYRVVSVLIGGNFWSCSSSKHLRREVHERKTQLFLA